MGTSCTVRYEGFEVRPLVREYTFSVRQAEMDPRTFTLTIANEAFSSHRARFQDAPDICSLRLHRELLATANHPEKTHFRITESDLDDYRATHSPKSTKKPAPPRTPLRF